MKPKAAPLVLMLITALLFTACNLAGPSIQATPPAATWTAIAQTIEAQLTQAAGGTVFASPTETTAAFTQAAPTIEAVEATATNTPLPEESPTATETTEATPEEPTATLQPTATETLTPTPPPEDPRLSLGNPDWSDTFENARNWSIYDDDHVDMGIEEDGLHMTSLKAESWDSWMTTWAALENFYLEATITPTAACTGRNRYGLVARAPEPTTIYSYGFTCDGRYSLRIWDGKRYITVVDWTSSEFIKTGNGQSNRIGLKVEGDKFQLYANGHLLKEAQDDTYDRGAFGLFIGSPDAANFTVVVSEISYWLLP